MENFGENSIFKSELLFLVPILLSVRRNFKLIKKGKISLKVFVVWYLLCLVICGTHELAEKLPGAGLCAVAFPSMVQGLLIGSLSLNLKSFGPTKRKEENRWK